jgi:hypothetical protein
MWSVIITGAATIAAVLYIQGPIVALVLTAVSSLALLVVLRAMENKKPVYRAYPQQLEVIDGNNENELRFPPLKQQAS